MRRANKEIKDKSVINDLLKTCHVGRLGTIGADGYPMVKPLNFAYHDGNIYFHTALEGEKVDDIRRNNRVCFEVDLPVAFLRAKTQPCEAEYLYRSVIIKGIAAFVEDRDEKIMALRLLMDKYQPGAGFVGFPEEKLAITGIVRIDIGEMAGKEDLGKGAVREASIKALEEQIPLPITLDKE